MLARCYHLTLFTKETVIPAKTICSKSHQKGIYSQACEEKSRLQVTSSKCDPAVISGDFCIHFCSMYQYFWFVKKRVYIIAFGCSNNKTCIYFSSKISHVEIHFLFGLAAMQQWILLKESNVTVNRQSSSIGWKAVVLCWKVEITLHGKYQYGLIYRPWI